MSNIRDQTTRTSPHADETPQAARFRIQPGASFGRYTVLEQLGRGGMGQVFAAYDEQLDRRVAIKVLLGPESRDLRALIRREAKALAQLSHPNVVVVHEVAEHDGRLFISMEYVAGGTLKDWIRKPDENRLQSGLDLLIQAASGLHAAHTVGMVHRDFKPANVLVGTDGRVRVADFGLARSIDSPSPQRHRLSTTLAASATASKEISGSAIAGTPAYMAPEQRRGAKLSAATDQYSFCVTAWEVLYGCRPSHDDSSNDDTTTVPVSLQAALRVGLSKNPSARHSSMAELVSVLTSTRHDIQGTPRPKQRSKRYIVYGSLGLVGALSAAGYRLGHVDQACSGAAREFLDVWSPERRDTVHARLMSKVGHTMPQLAAGVTTTLDEYANVWIDAHQDACEATEVRKEQSESLLDQRLRCLYVRREEFDAVVEVLETADQDVAKHAPYATAGLRSVSPCKDAKYVSATVEPPDSLVAPSVESLSKVLQLARAREELGQYQDGLRLMDSVIKGARAIEYTPLLSASLVQLGKLQSRAGKHFAAEGTFREAYTTAVSCGAEETATQAATQLALLSGVQMSRGRDALWWERLGRAHLQRTSDSDLSSSAELSHARCAAHAALGRLEQAMDDCERARTEHVAQLGFSHPRVAASYMYIGQLQVHAGDLPSALHSYEQALSINEATLGKTHPDIASLLSSAARVHRLLGDHESALVNDERALSIVQASLGEVHPSVANTLAGIGDTHRALGEYSKAAVRYERALEIARWTLGLRHQSVAQLEVKLGQVSMGQGSPRDASVHFKRAIAIWEHVGGERHPRVATSRLRLSVALAALHDEEQAESQATLATAIVDSLKTERTPLPEPTLNELASLFRAVGREAEALRVETMSR